MIVFQISAQKKKEVSKKHQATEVLEVFEVNEHSFGEIWYTCIRSHFAKFVIIISNFNKFNRNSFLLFTLVTQLLSVL